MIPLYLELETITTEMASQPLTFVIFLPWTRALESSHTRQSGGCTDPETRYLGI